MIFVYIISIIGLILMASGLVEITSPILYKYFSKSTIQLVDTVLYKLCLASMVVMLGIIFVFIVGGLIGLTLI